MDTTPSRKDFAAWYRAMAPAQKAAYASRAFTTRNYIESHLLIPSRIPRDEAMDALAKATGGAFSLAELAAWFYEASRDRRERRQQPPAPAMN